MSHGPFPRVHTHRLPGPKHQLPGHELLEWAEHEGGARGGGPCSVQELPQSPPWPPAPREMVKPGRARSGSRSLCAVSFLF